MTCVADRFRSLEIAAWKRRKLARDRQSSDWLTRRVAKASGKDAVALIRSIAPSPKPRLP